MSRSERNIAKKAGGLAVAAGLAFAGAALPSGQDAAQASTICMGDQEVVDLCEQKKAADAAARTSFAKFFNMTPVTTAQADCEQDASGLQTRCTVGNLCTVTIARGETGPYSSIFYPATNQIVIASTSDDAGYKKEVQENLARLQVEGGVSHPPFPLGRKKIGQFSQEGFVRATEAPAVPATMPEGHRITQQPSPEDEPRRFVIWARKAYAP